MYNRVLIKRFEEELVTQGGIHLNEAVRKQQLGKVIAKGPGTVNPISGVLSPINVDIGETVILPEYKGIAVDVDEKKFEIYSESELLARVLKEK